MAIKPPPGPDVNSLFEQLLEYKWKGVSFPTTTFRMVLRHDLAQHKYAGRDGANIEETGRAPYEFSASIPFVNGAVPGKGETWGILYPTQYRAFMAVAAVGKLGALQHPEFGIVTCMLSHCETVWSANTRDGVHVECTWLETIPADADQAAVSGELTTRASPVSNVLLGATDLDAQITTIQPPLPQLPAFEPTFADTMRGLTAISDQVSLLEQRGLGTVNAVNYRINTLEDSIDHAEQTTATTVKQIISPDQTIAAKNALLWPMRNSIELMRSSLRDVQNTQGTKNRQVNVWITTHDCSLASAAQDIGVSITDVIALNPALCRDCIIPKGSQVRYYADAVAQAA